MRHIALSILAAAVLTAGCASTSKDVAEGGEATKKPRQQWDYSREPGEMPPGPGIFSGPDGKFEIYSREAPGSADPHKPVRVDRRRR